MAPNACTQRHLPPPRPTVLSIGKLNIRDVRGFRLEQTIWEVDRGGFYVMILTKTKISITVYCQNRPRYKVTSLMSHLTNDGGAQGSVGIMTRERPIKWGIESTRYHSPNVVSCELVTRIIRT